MNIYVLLAEVVSCRLSKIFSLIVSTKGSSYIVMLNLC